MNIIIFVRSITGLLYWKLLALMNIIQYFKKFVCIFLLLSTPGFCADPDQLIFKGADYHFRGELDKALACFEEAAGIDEKNTYAANQLGILYAKKDNFSKAYKQFAKVARMDSKNTYARLWLGICYLKDGKLEDAFSKFNELLVIDPKNAEAYYYLGAIYNFRHNRKKAIEFLKKARDADSDEAGTHFRLAQAFNDADMLKNAQLEYERAIKLNPSHTKAINALGWLIYNKNNIDEAIEKWKTTLLINPKDSDAALNLAKAYNGLAWSAFKANDKKKAVLFWKKTLLVNPGNKAAKHNLKKWF